MRNMNVAQIQTFAQEKINFKSVIYKVMLNMRKQSLARDTKFCPRFIHTRINGVKGPSSVLVTHVEKK